MAFDLGALVTRLTVQGRAEFERDVDASGRALERAAKQGDVLGTGLDTAGRKSATFGAKIRQGAAELTYMGNASRQAFTTVGTGLTLAGLAATAFVGVGVARFAEYDAAMSKVSATTQTYGDDLAEVRQLTRDLGSSTVFTATEAAQGVTELAKAGVTLEQSVGGGLKGSLDLAAAGELDVAKAAEIAATALTVFRLRGEDIPHVADLLAAGAGKAQGSVEDLAAAQKQSALVSAAMGISIEENTGVLAEFASAGLIGSDAGTSFRTMLLSLSSPSSVARKELEKYNISAYDAQGNFVGMANLADQLHTRLGKLTQEQRDNTLATIFGSDAVRAANVLYRDGAAGVQKWTNAVDDSGYAARFASDMQNNLAGDSEKLQGAIDGLFITMGEGANGPLRWLVQQLTGLVDGFNDLPAPLQQTVMLGGGAVGVITLMGGAALFAVPKILAAREAVQKLATQMPGVAAAGRGVTSFLFGPWGLAMAAGVAAFIAWDSAQKDFIAGARQVASTLDAQTGAASKATAEFVAQKLAADGAFDAVKRFGIGHGELVDAILEGGPAYDELIGKMHDYQNGAGIFDAANGNAINSISGLRRQTEEAGRQFEHEKAAIDESTSATEDNADATGQTGDVHEEAAGQVDMMAKAIRGLAEEMIKGNDLNRDARAAVRDYEAALDDFDAKLAENGQTLDKGTEAGRENADALEAIAAAAESAAQKTLDAGGSEETYRKMLQDGRSALLDRIHDLGIQGEKAQDLADKIMRIPTKREFEAIAKTERARQQIEAFINHRWGTIYLTASLNLQNNIRSQLGAMRVSDYADGAVRHRADGAVDSIANQPPQMRAGGSYVVWAEAETEGETFLPHARSKRARSEALLAQTAALFGGTYIPAGSRQAADGFVAGAAVPGAARGPQRIEGTLDLGDGLVGFVRGVLREERGAVTAMREAAFERGME